MGGGGAMRAAAKVAGIGVVNGGLRGGVPAVPPAEQSVRKASLPFTAMISSAKSGGADVAAIDRPSWELIDDWEFAGGDHEFGRLDESAPMGRVVFGGVPSLEEAKVATDELKDALEKEFLSSPKFAASGGSFGVDQVSGLSLLSNSEYLETKSCITSHQPAAPVPKHAMKAFSLLSESPAAQSVVASIACDPKVWNAVFQNDALVDFLQSHKTSALCPDMNLNSAESVADSDDLDLDSSKKFVVSDASQFEKSGDRLMEILQKIKLTVVEMVHNVSDFIQNIFGFAASENESANANGNSSSIFVDKTLGASFMALAVMVIMVVVLKRG